MFRFLFILMILMLFIIPLSAESFVLGTGTNTTSTLPTYGFWGFGWGRMLYSASEMNSVGMNNSMDIAS
ncbi:MAG: hypothetical protein JXR56_04490, partial [Candidatus Cloacimonetes bacterium]|nr:hypothetical protein [Candidatus Cloacimonadota bacterium]